LSKDIESDEAALDSGVDKTCLKDTNPPSSGPLAEDTEVAQIGLKATEAAKAGSEDTEFPSPSPQAVDSALDKDCLVDDNTA
jgi:hypothetical protein